MLLLITAVNYVLQYDDLLLCSNYFIRSTNYLCFILLSFSVLSVQQYLVIQVYEYVPPDYSIFDADDRSLGAASAYNQNC